MAKLSVDEAGDDTPIGRIKRIMVIQGVSLRALAEHTGIPYPTLQANLSGVNAIKVDTLSAICDSLNISVDFILTGAAAVLDIDVVKDAIETLDQFTSLTGGTASGIEQRAQWFIYSYGVSFRQKVYSVDASTLTSIAKTLLKQEPSDIIQPSGPTRKGRTPAKGRMR